MPQKLLLRSPSKRISLLAVTVAIIKGESKSWGKGDMKDGLGRRRYVDKLSYNKEFDYVKQV